MKHIKKVLLAVFAVGAIALLAVFSRNIGGDSPGLSGRWELVIMSPLAEIRPELTLRSDGTFTVIQQGTYTIYASGSRWSGFQPFSGLLQGFYEREQIGENLGGNPIYRVTTHGTYVVSDNEITFYTVDGLYVVSAFRQEGGHFVGAGNRLSDVRLYIAHSPFRRVQE